MKKSFILSLVMVVVLIASLATATYAWYTSQTEIWANQVTVTTAGAADGLLISEAFISDTTFTNQEVNLTLTNGAVTAPMCLKFAEAPTTSATYGSFSGLTTTLKDNGTKAAAAGAISEFLTLATVEDVEARDGTGSYIFVANPGAGAGMTDYKVKVTITDGTVAHSLRVAIFELADFDNESALDMDDATLLGIWAKDGEKVGYTNAIANEEAFSGKFSSETLIATGTGVVKASGTYVSCGTAAALCSTNDVFAIKVWFEGDTITNSGAAKTQLFKIDFEIGTVA